MKALAVFLLAASMLNSVSSDESVDNYLTMCLENFAVAMREGIPVLGIPVLDPLYISQVPIPSISTPRLKFNANASDITIKDQSYYVPLVHAEHNFTIYYQLTLDQLNINGTYWCKGMALHVFPIFGDGYFTIRANDIRVLGVSRFYITPDGYMQISGLNTTIVFESLDVFFENILGGGSFGEEVNEAIELMGKLFFDALMPVVQKTIIPAMVEYMNAVLMQHTLLEIIFGALPSPPTQDVSVEA